RRTTRPRSPASARRRSRAACIAAACSCVPSSSHTCASRRADSYATRLSRDGGLESERLLQLGLGLCADRLSGRLAAAVEDDVRDAADPGPVGQRRLLVDVDLADLDGARALIGDLLDHRTEQPTGTAPRRPVVDEHWDVGV